MSHSSTSFRPGVSGNPGGRPTLAFTPELDALLLKYRSEKLPVEKIAAKLGYCTQVIYRRLRELNQPVRSLRTSKRAAPAETRQLQAEVEALKGIIRRNCDPYDASPEDAKRIVQICQEMN